MITRSVKEEKLLNCGFRVSTMGPSCGRSSWPITSGSTTVNDNSPNICARSATDDPVETDSLIASKL